MATTICADCRLVASMSDRCTGCGSSAVSPVAEPNEIILRGEVHVHHEKDTGTGLHAFISQLFVWSWIILVIVALQAVGAFIGISAALAGSMAIALYFSYGPRMRRRKTTRLAPTAIPPALVSANRNTEVFAGVAKGLDATIEAPTTPEPVPCLAWSITAGRPPGAVLVRAGHSAELLVGEGADRVVVTGTIWVVPAETSRTRRTLPERLGIPDTLQIDEPLVAALVHDGDRVRVHGTPAIEAHRAFATYRETTGPVLRGRPDAPIIIELVD